MEMTRERASLWSQIFESLVHLLVVMNPLGFRMRRAQRPPGVQFPGPLGGIMSLCSQLQTALLAR